MPDAAFAAAVVISTCLAEASSDVVAAVTCSDVVAVVAWTDAAEGIWSQKCRKTMDSIVDIFGRTKKEENHMDICLHHHHCCHFPSWVGTSGKRLNTMVAWKKEQCLAALKKRRKKARVVTAVEKHPNFHR